MWNFLIVDTKFGFICGEWNLYYNFLIFQNSLNRIVDTALCYGKLNFVCSSRAFCKMHNFKERFRIKQSTFSNWEHNKKDETFPRKYIYQMLTNTRISAVYKHLLKFFLMELYVNFITRAAEVTLASELLWGILLETFFTALTCSKAKQLNDTTHFKVHLWCCGDVVIIITYFIQWIQNFGSKQGHVLLAMRQDLQYWGPTVMYAPRKKD